MRKSLIILLLLPLLLAGCQSYKKVPYLQDALQEVAAGNTGTADMPLYDARIMPKDLLTIVVSCPEEPELAIPFNLTVTSPLSKENNYLTNQPKVKNSTPSTFLNFSLIKFLVLSKTPV
jgi:polysaccharide export outer membrane protein